MTNNLIATNDIRVSFRGNETVVPPGASLSGSVNWNLSSPVQAVEIRLVWFTRGKGTTDISVVETRRVEHPPSMGDAGFQFILPEGPMSFSGRLISLLWAVEAVALPPGRGELASGRQEFTLSTIGREIVLQEIPEDQTISPTMQKFKQRKEEYQRSRGQMSS